MVLLGRVCRVRVCSLELLPLARHRIQLEWAKIVKLDSIYSIVYQRISVFFFFLKKKKITMAFVESMIVFGFTVLDGVFESELELLDDF